MEKGRNLGRLVAVCWVFLSSLAVHADNGLQTSNFSIGGRFLLGADDHLSMPRTETFSAEDFSLAKRPKGSLLQTAANRLVPVEGGLRSNTVVRVSASNIVWAPKPALSQVPMQPALPRDPMSSNLTRQQVITIAFVAVLITLVVIFVPRT